MAETQTIAGDATLVAPHPGSQQMPRWNVGELPEAPRFAWRNWWHFLGPGLLMGGAAIGGGEWLTGPIVTAKYGGSLLWLATLSILGQVLYNIEISRYTLYSGEPIFTGKCRTLPGPIFWVCVYVLLDFGSVFPYLAANAATPLASVWLGEIPDPVRHKALLKGLAVGIFLACFIPLIFGGKVYNSLKAVMTFKIVTVLGFLLLVALCFSHATTWKEIATGFFKFGSVPIERAEDANNNGVLDPGEDWDRDGHLDVVEKKHQPSLASKAGGPNDQWPDVNGDGKPDRFDDVDGDGFRDGDNVENVFVAFFTGKLPKIDFTLVAMLSALVAVSGQGGLTNTPISNYTRDQGWGMGAHVGAIPSLVGGHNIQLSHVGMVFLVDDKSLPRWRRWYRHVARDQLWVWMPACFFGLALPSMLSVEFLRRGTDADEWVAAGMTADAVRNRVAEAWGSGPGQAFWFMTLFCGFLVLAPTTASTIDGFVRRWVDVFWTASRRLHSLDPGKIRHLYFSVLLTYGLFGLVMLSVVPKPGTLLKIAASIYNFALGFSCWHVVALNVTLLPRELRPNWAIRIGLALAGLFFWCVASISAYKMALDFLAG
ncbi:MAG: Nramp family divalent metal transporter [Planctomycetaceae bacterium]